MTTDPVAEAAETLYGAPLDQFVAERKRLAAELKASDKAAAKRVAELKKPNTSAWVVNLLWRDAGGKAEIERLFEAAARIRDGDFGASADQRASLASLRKRATQVLTDGGHKPAEAMLSRVQQTLQALSAYGGWEPDAPGQLVEDRDPPGFDALGGLAGKLPQIKREERAAPKRRSKEEDQEAKAREAAAARKLAEREVARLEKAVERAEAAAEARARDVEQARKDLEDAEAAATDARRERNELARDLERARKKLG